MKKYRGLKQQVWQYEDYELVPIRDKDRLAIMRWRNEQMYHLRQSSELTPEDQDRYFEKVVAPLFELERPNQVLFSYLHKAKCIGYGGLVHINWYDGNAELSFIMQTSLEEEGFAFHWSTYLKMIEKVAFQELNLHKVFTYAIDLRPRLYPVLKEAGFTQEAILKDHVFFDGSYVDVILHRKLNTNE
ncbi:GNAT family N-acetyltransferase [Roseivirga pacifica]|uniref:GNAT family N-acetyltransferase n=1 Tax=Roseivirga pacifica TaxID=1267423 RepID=UPI0020958C7A|nr:GNAT family N-acetyltransferase [Roseivirga pacifica]MCO6359483.1 GNAT family N-acetyltransferase [Roseivirga pacifica]MCO6366853.1 GNAT family N-acetyltransferase [Roseivirga pacifica]MCO6370615.1 GNAT family N-acetyltransferase [Roseivirga pacifica]MCO6374509.1 GNAT family N-acetyltransferase [Roseivirga pacifica]MCO6379768.1 GNAT family N-acetyltransferase [Roseivirga pacifica]